MEKNFQILCVDDSRDYLKIVGECLDTLPYNIHLESSVKDAIKYVEDHSDELALILTDYKMPEMTGLDFRKRLIDNFSDIPFAVISSYVSKKMAMEGIELKVSAYFEKEITPDKLLESVENLIVDRIDHLESEKEIKEAYLEESLDMLNEMEAILLTLEDAENPTVSLNSVFRLAHTIKGGSGFLNNKGLGEFVHQFEEVLTKLKNGSITATEALVGNLLKSTDELKKIFTEYTNGSVPELDQGFLMSLVQVDESESHQSAQKETVKGAENTPVESEGQASKQSIDIPVELLDIFVEKSGELVVKKNMISKVIRSLESKYPLDREVQFLDELIEETHKVIGGIQKNISDLRKTPVATLVRFLKRQCREISVQVGKKVNFNIIGEEIRMDNKIYEVFNKSLIHILRNSMDHGLELVDDREKAGKSPDGLITVEFKESEDAVELRFSDDGRGIDANIIRKKVLEKELCDPGRLKKLSDHDVIQFIFHPGFSTAATVTSISGRGVGMDMVKTSVEQIGGKISIHTEPGHGSDFNFYMPKPKAVNIIDSVGVTVGSLVLQIDSEEIDRVLDWYVEGHKSIVDSVSGSKLIEIEGELIPVIEIAKELEVTSDSGNSDTDPGFVISIRTSQARFGIIVDTIVNSENIVVTKIPGFIDPHGIYKGYTILGDGKIGLVLNPEGLANKMAILEKSDHAGQFEGQIDSGGSEAHNRGTDGQVLVLGNYHGFKTGIKLNHVLRLVALEASQIQVIGDDYYVVLNQRQYVAVDLFGILESSSRESSVYVILVQADRMQYAFIVDTLSDIFDYENQVQTDFYDQEIFEGIAEFENDMCLLFDVEQIKSSNIKNRKLIS